MTKTKWLRLLVRDPADILRWAGEQQARGLGEFRYRVIRGREIVSFRLVPGYAIQIGSRDIVVVAHVRPGRWRLGTERLQALAATAVGALRRAYAGAASAAIGSLPLRPTPMKSTISAAPMHISPDSMKASR
jgi:hypothetical protein